MNSWRPVTTDSFVEAVLLFFPTLFALVFCLFAFVAGVVLEIARFRKLGSLILRVAGNVFFYIFLPLSERSGLFRELQGRRGSSPA
jgi:hypothetical protein